MNAEPVSQSMATVRVFLADDHPIFLDGMRALIMAEPGLELVGMAGDGETALRLAIALRPDVAVLDLSMPGLNGLEVSRALLSACPSCRVVVLTVHEDAAYLRELLDMGIAGYVLKRSATEGLGRSIHAVARGGIYLDPAIAGRALSTGGRRPKDAVGPGAKLSAREMEVLRLTSAGHSNKVIAEKLSIGVKSVDTYKSRAMAKMGFANRVEVVRFAVARGWMTEL
jgi:DNA-binding NarL/FixJ family response regulator